MMEQRQWGLSRASVSPAEANAPAVLEGAARCERCGQPARLCTLRAYEGGQAQYQFACLHCADALEARPAPRRGAGPRLRRGTTVAVFTAGLMLAVIALFADVLIPGGLRGFGQLQVVAGFLCGVVAFIGVLFRAHALVLGGLLAMVVAVTSGLRDPGELGLGWKQAALLAVGIALMVGSAWDHYWRAAQGDRRRGPAAGGVAPIRGR